MATFGSRLKQLREESGMTQRQLSDIMGYKSERSVQKIEADESAIDQVTLCNLADMFDVSADYLLGRSDKKGQSSPTKGNGRVFKYSDYTNIGRQIYVAREEKGITREKLAEALGLTIEALIACEARLFTIPLSVVPTIAKELGVEVSYLFGWTSPESEVKEIPHSNSSNQMNLFGK